MKSKNPPTSAPGSRDLNGTIPKGERPSFAVIVITWILGGVCMALGQGHFPNPVFAVLGVACWLHLTRSSPTWLAFLAILLGNVLAWEVCYRGMIPLPTAGRLGVEVGLSTAFACCFLFDKLVSRTASGTAGLVLSVFAFPAAWVTVDYLNTMFSPTGSWSSIAYSYVGDQCVDQVASVFGWTGLTFLTGFWATILVGWFAPRLNHKNKSVVPFLGMVSLIIVVALGSVRGVDFSEEKGKWRIAQINTPGSFKADRFLEELWEYTRGVPQSEERQTRAVRQIAKSRNQFFELVVNQFEGGADFVIWSEAIAVVTGSEELQWIEDARSIATRFEGYIGVALIVYHPDSQSNGGLRSENKLILVGPTGDVETEYQKRTRVPGDSHDTGMGPLPLIDTRLGVVSAAICFDMDFPDLIRSSAGRCDLLVAPSNDWGEAAATHARMAQLRAIENGCWIARPTKDGYTFLANPFGKLIAQQSTLQSETSVLDSQFTPYRVDTLYNRIGDSLAWASIGLVLITMLVKTIGFFSKRKNPAQR